MDQNNIIGIIGAMEVEVQQLCSQMEDASVECISGITYTRGRLRGRECVVAMCGIGKVNAAMCAQTMILRYHPALVINTGVAGGIGDGVHIGDIVLATDVVQHDMDTTAVGDEKGFLSGVNLVHVPCGQEVLKSLRLAAKQMPDTNFHEGTVATGDQFISGAQALHRIRREFGAMACEMEGGSIGQVCYLNQVPFAVVRAISDNADETSHMDYPTFVQLAAQKSVRLIENFLELA